MPVARLVKQDIASYGWPDEQRPCLINDEPLFNVRAAIRKGKPELSHS